MNAGLGIDGTFSSIVFSNHRATGNIIDYGKRKRLLKSGKRKCRAEWMTA